MSDQTIVYVDGEFTGEVTLGPPTGQYGPGDGDPVGRHVTLVRQGETWIITTREAVDGIPLDHLVAAKQHVDDPAVVAFLDTLARMIADPRGFAGSTT